MHDGALCSNLRGKKMTPSLLFPSLGSALVALSLHLICFLPHLGWNPLWSQNHNLKLQDPRGASDPAVQTQSVRALSFSPFILLSSPDCPPVCLPSIHLTTCPLFFLFWWQDLSDGGAFSSISLCLCRGLSLSALVFLSTTTARVFTSSKKKRRKEMKAHKIQKYIAGQRKRMSDWQSLI